MLNVIFFSLLVSGYCVFAGDEPQKNNVSQEIEKVGPIYCIRYAKAERAYRCNDHVFYLEKNKDGKVFLLKEKQESRAQQSMLIAGLNNLCRDQTTQRKIKNWEYGKSSSSGYSFLILHKSNNREHKEYQTTLCVPTVTVDIMTDFQKQIEDGCHIFKLEADQYPNRLLRFLDRLSDGAKRLIGASLFDYDNWH